MKLKVLIQSADPHSWQVVIIVFVIVLSVCTFVRTYTFQNLAKQNKFQVKTMFTTGETVGLAERIMDDTCLVLFTLFLSSFCLENSEIHASHFKYKFRFFVFGTQEKGVRDLLKSAGGFKVRVAIDYFYEHIKCILIKIYDTFIIYQNLKIN